MGERTEGMRLRRGVLAVCVLDDISLTPQDDGISLEVDEGRSPGVPIPWSELALAVGTTDPESEVGRYRLRDWLRTRAVFAELGPMAAWRAEQAAVPLGLPCDHPLHPGASWVREPVLGGALDLGVGIRGLISPDPDHVAVLPAELAKVVGLRTMSWWPALRARLEEMGRLTIARLERDATGVIAPMGGCDAVTLLGARSLRAYLARGDGTGMRAVAAPMRSRAWFDLARIDPAFIVGAAAATDDTERGFSRSLLITGEEVAIAVPGGDLTTIVLRDPSTADAAWPSA